MLEKQNKHGTNHSIYSKNHLNNLYSRNEQESGKDDHLISVIIPLYNEENTIKDVINKIPNHLHYEIIVVDDGSTDNSINKIKEIRNRYVKIVKHERNEGYGAAILTGIKLAQGEIIITLDSDGQHCSGEIPNLLTPIINNQADMVIGSRYLGKCYFKIPIYTRLGEILIKLFLKLFYRQKVSNSQNGFRAYNKKSIKCLNNLKFTGMGFSTETLFKIAHKRLKIKEIPMTANPRKYGISYVKLTEVFKSIVFCIVIYFFLNFKINLYRILKE